MSIIFFWIPLSLLTVYASATLVYTNFRTAWAVWTLGAIIIFCLFYGALGFLLIYFVPLVIVGTLFRGHIKRYV